MRKTCVLFFVLATVLFIAQTSPAQLYVDVTLEASGITAGRIIPMGNTVNDDFVVFYDLLGTRLDLKSRVVHADGTLGPARIIATLITLGVSKRFDVAWNPRSKSYLVIYHKGGKLWAQKVKANGARARSPQAITSYTGENWTVTASKKKSFVLFLSRDGKLVTQLIRAKGKKLKGENIIITNTKKKNYPLDSVSTSDGTAFLVYTANPLSSSTSELYTLRLSGGKNILGSLRLGKFNHYDVYCAHDPDDDVFAVVWRKVKANYCILDGNEHYVQAPTEITYPIRPLELIYNVAKNQFMIHFQELNFYLGVDHTSYYYMPINPDGSRISDGNFMVTHDHENDGFGFGVSNLGSLLVAWTAELDVGIHARLLWF